MISDTLVELCRIFLDGVAGGVYLAFAVAVCMGVQPKESADAPQRAQPGQQPKSIILIDGRPVPFENHN
jgi:hypothetical protein